jgi:hypothetical protein
MDKSGYGRTDKGRRPTPSAAGTASVAKLARARQVYILLVDDSGIESGHGGRRCGRYARLVEVQREEDV